MVGIALVLPNILRKMTKQSFYKLFGQPGGAHKRAIFDETRLRWINRNNNINRFIRILQNVITNLSSNYLHKQKLKETYNY